MLFANSRDNHRVLQEGERVGWLEVVAGVALIKSDSDPEMKKMLLLSAVG